MSLNITFNKAVFHGQALSNAFHAPVRDFLKNKPGSYLEIGIYYGRFIAEVANEFPERDFHGIDPFISDGCTRDAKGTIMNDIEEIATVNASQVSNLTLYKNTTEEFLKREDAKEILKNVSCVLIDGSHHREDIIHDLNLVMQIENDYEKVVIFDDIRVPDVAQSIQDLINMLFSRLILTDEYQSHYVAIQSHPHYVAIYFK